MTPEARERANAYFETSQSWKQDQNNDLRRSQRIAWIIALVATITAAIEALAILWLMPLKTVVPYTLLVDRQTGYVQALDPLEPRSISPDRALTQSFLVQYVLSREGFDRKNVQQDYRKALLWSAETARREYAALMPVTNPQSPLVRLSRGTTIEATVRSISSLSERSALIRFDTVQRGNGGAAQSPQPWVAIVDFRFSKAPLSVDDRYLNPLGFQVTRYRRSAEALAPAIEQATLQTAQPSIVPGQQRARSAAPLVSPTLPSAIGGQP